MKLKSVLLSAFILSTPLALSAETWNCQLSQIAGVSGFKDRSIAESWTPKTMTVTKDGDKVSFQYFSDLGVDESSKAIEGGFEARDEVGLKNSQTSLLMKAKVTFDLASNTMKFRAGLNAGGYRNANIGGNYVCK